MKRRKQIGRIEIRLSTKERTQIKKLLKQETAKVREIRRAIILQTLDQGESTTQAARIVGMSQRAAYNIARRYQEGGLDKALHDRPKPGQPRKLNDKQKNQIIAMTCANPPEGYSRWTVELITEQTQKRGIAQKTNRESIRLLLKEHDLKPWRKKNVVHSRSDPRVH